MTERADNTPCLCFVLSTLWFKLGLDPQQNDDQDDVVRITTNLVQVDAVVTKDGKVVPRDSAG